MAGLINSLFGGGSSFDPAKFADELNDLKNDVSIQTIVVDQYESTIMFLQRLAHYNADLSQHTDLQAGMQEMNTLVSAISTPGNSQPGGATWQDPLVTSCVRQVRGESHCLNLFVFLNQVHSESVDLSGDTELENTMNNVAVQLNGVTTGTGALALPLLGGTASASIGASAAGSGGNATADVATSGSAGGNAEASTEATDNVAADPNAEAGGNEEEGGEEEGGDYEGGDYEGGDYEGGEEEGGEEEGGEEEGGEEEAEE